MNSVLLHTVTTPISGGWSLLISWPTGQWLRALCSRVPSLSGAKGVSPNGRCAFQKIKQMTGSHLLLFSCPLPSTWDRQGLPWEGSQLDAGTEWDWLLGSHILKVSVQDEAWMKPG